MSAYLKHVISILFEFARRFLHWFSREDLDDTMFNSFKKSFPKNRCTIDGFEMRTQIPQSVRAAVLKWSSYKNYHTWKGLVANGK